MILLRWKIDEALMSRLSIIFNSWNLIIFLCGRTTFIHFVQHHAAMIISRLLSLSQNRPFKWSLKKQKIIQKAIENYCVLTTRIECQAQTIFKVRSLLRRSSLYEPQILLTTLDFADTKESILETHAYWSWPLCNLSPFIMSQIPVIIRIQGVKL